MLIKGITMGLTTTSSIIQSNNYLILTNIGEITQIQLLQMNYNEIANFSTYKRIKLICH